MRKEKKWLHRISSMILSFLMVLQVFSGSFGNMQVHAQNDADIWQGIGENIGMPWNAIYITHPKYTEFKLQMFCIEAKKEFPKENAPIEYELIKPAKDDLIKKSFNQPNTNADVALEGVKRVLWNGHPWNASGLKEKYDVTEEEFQLVTTMAMQYWTDSYWGNKGSNYIHDNHEAFKIDSQRKREKKLLLVDMFKELVGLGEYVLSDPPSDAEFLLGIPHGVEYARSYQKILSMDLKKYPIHFIKVNENGEKISGARLKVTKLDPPFTSIAVGDDYNLEWTSDEKKEGELGYFAFGSYKLEEIKTPDGGYVPFDKFNFNIVPGGKIEFPGGKPSYVTGVETRIEELNGYEQTVSYFTIKNEKTEAPKPQYKGGKLKTTVKVDNKSESEQEVQAGKNLTVVIGEKAAKKDVVDTVAYSDLVGGAEYELTGKLMKIVDGKEPEQVGEAVKKTFKADVSGSGTEEMTFKDVNIEVGVKYVVFEEAVSKEKIEFKEETKKHIVTHHDKDDKSQTFNVEKE
ncbi:TPA: VaFE repeat-containing surface-anchored protein, partial [Streptococcus suis]|nr:VaFE repeat-containing surface-anchored protein [Streptococcus suis]